MAAVRFFAAAAEAAGTDALSVDAATLGELKTQLVQRMPALAALLDRCAVLVDGSRVGDEHPLTGVGTIDVLPPFAGG